LGINEKLPLETTLFQTLEPATPDFRASPRKRITFSKHWNFFYQFFQTLEKFSQPPFNGFQGLEKRVYSSASSGG